MRRLFLAVAMVWAAAAIAQTDYPVFETDKITPAEHRQHRETVKAKMDEGSMALFFTNPEMNRNNDVDFLFRGDSNFLYLTGFEEPDSCLLLIPGGMDLDGKRVTEVLFVNVSNPMSETWLGYRMGPENAKKLLGIEAAVPNTDFSKVMTIAAAAASAKKVSVANLQPGAGGALLQMENAYKAWKEANGFTDGANLRRTISAMRQIKTPAEIALIKKAAEISARAHVEAMRSAQPGMREWEIGALVQYIFAKEGCEYTGYPPICGSGPNSTILHYDSNRRLMQSGDMMCMDTAGEFHGYSADVTRSFPINGKFTPEQRAVYQVVYDAQSTGIDMCRNGASVGGIEQKIRQVLSAGLIKLGIIKSANELGTYYMHGFGHGIGLDVHDPLPGTLVPGVILTVEPGIYIKAGSPCDKKWWNIGIRIEDDILVTDIAPLNLSAGAPRTADAIEKLMAETGIGNIKQAPLKAGG